MIRFAKDKDIPSLMELWQAAFHDSAEATALVFGSLNKTGRMLVLTDGENDAVAMLCLREFFLTTPYKKYKAAYIYGVATAQEHRGKGFGTLLLEDAHKLLMRRGCVCAALVPSEKSLFDFYGQRGFETAFNIKKAEIGPGSLKAGEVFPLLPVIPERYAQIRYARFSDSKMIVCWDADYLSYIGAESKLYGGGIFGLKIHNKELCLACYRDGGTVYVKELAATAATAEAAVRSVAAHFNPERIVVYLREDMEFPYTNKILPFGMVKWYDNTVQYEISALKGAAPYIAHVLD